jgi:hypothetical protein
MNTNFINPLYNQPFQDDSHIRPVSRFNLMAIKLTPDILKNIGDMECGADSVTSEAT